MNTATQTVRILENSIPPFAPGTQNQMLAPVIHSGLAPIEGISFGLVKMPGGHQTKAHLHGGPVVVHLGVGYAVSLVGETMEPVYHVAGSVCYIGPGVPHAAVNLYPHTTDPGLQDSTTCLASEARTDPSFSADVQLRPDLDDLALERAEWLRGQFRHGELTEYLAEPHVNLVFL